MPRLLFVDNDLERSSSNLRIEVQTGTRKVVLEGDYITGFWDAKGAIYRIGEGRAIALNVLNPFLGSDRLEDAVLDFTKRFGPITIPFCSDASFSFSIGEWKRARQDLYVVWKGASSGLKRKWQFNLPVDKSDGDHFSFENGRPAFRTQNLSKFMDLEIATVPAKGFKRCASFAYGCKSPYFFSSDLRERYCSETCAHESKKRAKLKWWDENRRGGEDGAQKAR
jgi:hypothetical protein